jgi:hypothetical protein
MACERHPRLHLHNCAKLHSCMLPYPTKQQLCVVSRAGNACTASAAGTKNRCNDPTCRSSHCNLQQVHPVAHRCFATTRHYLYQYSWCLSLIHQMRDFTEPPAIQHKLQRETEAKARQPKTKLGASIQYSIQYSIYTQLHPQVHNTAGACDERQTSSSCMICCPAFWHKVIFQSHAPHTTLRQAFAGYVPCCSLCTK